LEDAEQSIKRLNSGKTKLDEVFSFGRHPHYKIGLSYDEFNEAVNEK
jgi:hypothetical protein